jgi:hypothetical protein
MESAAGERPATPPPQRRALWGELPRRAACTPIGSDGGTSGFVRHTEVLDPTVVELGS